MSTRSQFTIQLINDIGESVPNAQVLVINRATTNLVVPYADEFSSTYVPNLETNVNGIAQAWLPLGPYTATANSPYLPTSYTQSFDIVPYSSVTVSGGGSGGGLAVISILPIVTTGGALTVASHTPVNAASAPITMTLPTGSAQGILISTEKYDSSTNAVSITGNIREIAAQTLTLKLAHEQVLFEASSTGSWWPIGGHDTLSSLDGRYFQIGNNLSEGVAATIRSNLGLGTAAQQNTGAFDASGTAATAITTLLASNDTFSGNINFSGAPTTTTPPIGDNSNRIADTAFVQALASGVTSVFGRAGVVVAQTGDYSVGQVTGAAPIANANLTGIPTAPTAAPLTGTTQLANLAYVDAEGATKAAQTNPTISGLVTASGYVATGMTGTHVTSRWVGATTSGVPSTGTFNAGDFVVDKSGTFRICTTGGSPGTWVTPYGVGSGGGNVALQSRQYSGTSDVLTITDANNVVESTGSSASTETIPPNAVVPFPLDTIIELTQYGTGQITVVASGSSSVSEVQKNDGGATSGSPATILTSNATLGNSIALAVISSLGTTTVSGIGIFTKVNSVSVPSDGVLEWWYCPLVTVATNAVTITATGGGTYAAQANELASAGAASTGGSTTGTSTTGGLTMTPSTAGSIAFVVINANSSFNAGPTAPWVDYNSGATWTLGNGQDAAYQIVSGGGAITATWTLAGSASWGAVGMIVVPGSTVILRSPNNLVHTRTQYSTIAARQRALNEWVLSGDLS